jgi:hypothetical protein
MAIPLRSVGLATALALAGATAACDRNSMPGGGAPDPHAQEVEAIAANSTFSVAAAAETPILALRVRITADTVQALDARFLRAPLRTGDGQPDLLVTGLSGGRIVHQYAIPDPLSAEIEVEDRGTHRTLRLPEATVWIYMPAVALDAVEISPAREDEALPRGRVETAALLGRLCADAPSVEDCAHARLAEEAADRPSAASAPPSAALPSPARPAMPTETRSRP